MRLCHNPLFVIASDRRERGNPTRKVVARAKPVAISRVPSPPQADRDKASVAALPRNDIMTTASREGKLLYIPAPCGRGQEPAPACIKQG
ncbi:MAG: hypothetical protein A2022_06505 [Deltaproteobacteria bacterium GWF2_42_12]|nr:MAG: hypothetical protein A2090_10035 [Deltaproteobacteria bacterium GWD2_42_10]OGP48208.1 MAG: hypothetical protein A2022_06505 [Deltaproteobacteria bacterium GWF2_42_12]